MAGDTDSSTARIAKTPKRTRSPSLESQDRMFVLPPIFKDPGATYDLTLSSDDEQPPPKKTKFGTNRENAEKLGSPASSKTGALVQSITEDCIEEPNQTAPLHKTSPARVKLAPNAITNLYGAENRPVGLSGDPIEVPSRADSPPKKKKNLFRPGQAERLKRLAAFERHFQERQESAGTKDAVMAC